ncbi:DNA repair protein RecO [candidate division KSB1 bacterium]
MSIIKAESIILSDLSQGETSKIIRIYTKEYGKMSLIAKGSRKAKNRFGGSLDPLNHTVVVCYYKENRDLQIMSTCDVLDNFAEMKSDLGKLSYALSIAEILSKLIVEEEQNELMFKISLDSFRYIDSSERNYYNYYIYFLLGFLKLSGFGIDFQNCNKCGKVIDPKNTYLTEFNSRLVCEQCANKNLNDSFVSESLQVLRAINSKEPEKIENLSVSDKARYEILNFLDGYYGYHFDEYKTPQALKLLN